MSWGCKSNRMNGRVKSLILRKQPELTDTQYVTVMYDCVMHCICHVAMCVCGVCASVCIHV